MQSPAASPEAIDQARDVKKLERSAAREENPVEAARREIDTEVRQPPGPEEQGAREKQEAEPGSREGVASKSRSESRKDGDLQEREEEEVDGQRADARGPGDEAEDGSLDREEEPVRSAALGRGANRRPDSFVRGLPMNPVGLPKVDGLVVMTRRLRRDLASDEAAEENELDAEENGQEQPVGRWFHACGRF